MLIQGVEPAQVRGVAPISVHVRPNLAVLNITITFGASGAWTLSPCITE